MSFLAILLHLLSQDYQPAESSPSYYASNNALSFNASLFAAVCLASRLGSSFEAFVLLAVAVLTVALVTWLKVSTLLALSVIVVHAFVMLVAPWLFVRWQAHKDTINGPWDEAVPNI